MPQKRPSRDDGDGKAAKKPSHLPEALSSGPSALKKTERSHEENQERAYIAASRRSDRSIEARLQSAKMASEIHKRRTGKSFRITEEIVRKEEMYEEEEDDLPRSYRVLNSHMQTDSPEFNARIEAWMQNKVMMADLMRRSNDEWNGNAINRLFAQSFPQANQQAQEMARQMNIPGQRASSPYPQQSQPFQPPPSPYHQPQSPYPQQQPSPYHQPSTPQSPMSPSFNTNQNPTRMMGMGPSQMAAASPAPQSPAGPMPMPTDPEQSAFTSELPAELAQMMMPLPLEFGGQMPQDFYGSGMGQTGFTPNGLEDNTASEKFAELGQNANVMPAENAWTNVDDDTSWENLIDPTAFAEAN